MSVLITETLPIQSQQAFPEAYTIIQIAYRKIGAEIRQRIVFLALSGIVWN